MTDEQAKMADENSGKIPLLTFTNNKDPENLGQLQGLLQMVIHTVFSGRLACMQALNKETGNEELILVGTTQDENGVGCYPLFVPIRAEDVSKYLGPDGQGGWIGEVPAEVETE